VFLSEKPLPENPAQRYADYRARLTPALGIVSTCSSARSNAGPGNVVTAFTIDETGKAASVYVNESESARERPLWTCIRDRLREARFEPPPGGSLSVVYTFRFAGTTRVEF
jgi:hypothetical protein